jgi:hypothetical protein
MPIEEPPASGNAPESPGASSSSSEGPEPSETLEERDSGALRVESEGRAGRRRRSQSSDEEGGELGGSNTRLLSGRESREEFEVRDGPESSGAVDSPGRVPEATEALSAAFEELNAERLSLASKRPVDKALTIIRYLVDMFRVSLACVTVVVGMLVIIRLTAYREKVSPDLSSDAPFVYGAAVFLDLFLVAFLLQVGTVALVLWYQLSWKRSRRRLLICAALGVVGVVAQRLIRWYLIPSAVVIFVGAVFVVFPMIFFVGKGAEKDLGMKNYASKSTLATALLFASVSLYFLLIDRILSYKEDWQRALLRLFVHPILWELAYFASRVVALSQHDLPPAALMAIPTYVFL